MTVHTPIPSRTRGLPAWATWLTVLLLLVGAVYLVSNLSGTNPSVARGPQTSAAPSGSGAVNASVALALIKTAGCQACHGQNFEGGIGPDLHGIAAGPVTADLKPVADANPDTWIHLWIAGKDPAVASIDRKGMPVFGDQLSDSEIDTIVAYLKTLQ
jgi:mono/diheme cytochrome c family protein